MDFPKPNLKATRKYIPADFNIIDWPSLSIFFLELLEREIRSVDDLKHWIFDRNELEAAISENSRRRYIRLSCNALDPEIEKDYRFFVEEIAPKVSPYTHHLNDKLIHSSFVGELDEKSFGIYLRTVRNAWKLFREENIPLLTEVQIKTKEYGGIAAEMTIELNGKEYTLQQAGALLTEPDRQLRKKVYLETSERRLKDSKILDDLFDDLLIKRHQIAINAGFENYRDFKFAALERFDYSPQDCYDFHDAIASEIVPFIDRLNKKRKASLGVAELKPWDLNVDPEMGPALKPFKGSKDLVEKSISCFSELHPYFGHCLKTMDKIDHLDLDSRKGKRPGGYNMPLPETGIPFIFMNAADSMRDMRTMMHEGGHAVHSFLTRNLQLNSDKRPPSEVAELAAMSMELLSMDRWDSFFKDPEELKRAKLWQLQKSANIIPWVAAIDQFQHWLYLHPAHSITERDKAWTEIFTRFESPLVDWTGLEYIRSKLWQRQLHLFEVPFYYIEYAIAQLGAIAIWRNHRRNPGTGIGKYIQALKLGYTVPISEIYEAAGIKFLFSRAYVKELVDFLEEELQSLQN